MEWGCLWVWDLSPLVVDVMDEPKFGVAGYPKNFWDSDLPNDRARAFGWLAAIGLDWIELQCTRGVKMPDDQAEEFRALAEEHHLGVSVHAPYFIVLASGKADVVRRSRERLARAFELATKLGASRVITHPGPYPGSTRSDRRAALRRLVGHLNSLEGELPTDRVNLYPEVAGKVSQLGSVEEIAQICQAVSYARPCIDFAHAHARQHGSLHTTEDIVRVFELLSKELGDDVLEGLHCHVYPVAYNEHGERAHKAFSDRKKNLQLRFWQEQKGGFDPRSYYPQAEPFVEAFLAVGAVPVTICEAKDTQDTGALLMKRLYVSKRLRTAAK